MPLKDLKWYIKTTKSMLRCGRRKKHWPKFRAELKVMQKELKDRTEKENKSK